MRITRLPERDYWSVEFAGMEADQEVKFLGLPDGRRISYRKMGVSKETATRSLLVLHGLASSRLAGMPGKQRWTKP